MPESKQEIPIEVVEVDPNETHTPQKTLFRATKDSIAGGKALPKRPVSAVKSANSDVHKASSKSPFDLTALSPAKVFQPEPRQQKAESPNLSAQQPKPEPTAMSTTGFANAPANIPLVLKPEPTAIAPANIPPVLKPEPTAIAPANIPPVLKPEPTAIAPANIPAVLKPEPTAIAPANIPLVPKPEPTAMSTTGFANAPTITSPVLKPEPTAMSTTGFANAPAIRSPVLKPEPTAIAPANIPPVPKPQPTAIAPTITSPVPKPEPTAMSTTGFANAPAIRSPVLKPERTAMSTTGFANAPAIRSPVPKPERTAMSTTGFANAPAIRSPVLKPERTAMSTRGFSTRRYANTYAPANIPPVPKPKKIAVVPNITPPPALPRKTAIAPATIPPAPKPKKLAQAGTRLSGRTPSQAQSSRKTGAASLLGGTVSVSGRNFSGDYLAGLPNSNRDRQATSGIDASSQNIDITFYLKQLQQQVKQQWLPEVSQSSRRTVLNFTVNRSGQLSNLQLAQTSGFSVTDQAALNAIQRAAPFAPLPTGYTSNHIDIQFTFNINVYGQLNLSGDGG
ncbi:energy transducer TonB family protein [Nostoc sp.]|uniref:energy transducer TonB family protein n=1 Tax=Nostoc sp. TaxID=1180 RepID=UPI002FF49DDA